MNNEEMFQTILKRMDSMETNLSGRMDRLDGRMDGLEDRMDKLKSDMDMEFYAVRAEMDVVYKSSQQQFHALNNKFDQFMYTKDIVEYDKINIRFEALEKVYQELKEV